jgi:hypothetical protein
MEQTLRGKLTYTGNPDGCLNFMYCCVRNGVYPNDGIV